MTDQPKPHHTPSATAAGQARFGLLYFKRRLHAAWIVGPAEGSVRLLLEDGRELTYPEQQLLYTWLGAAQGDALARTAPAELRERAAAWEQDDPEPLLDALYGKAPADEPLDFEALAALALPPQADAWARAGLFRALLLERRRFRFSDGRFTALTPEALRRRDAQQRRATQQQHWLAQALAWSEAVREGAPAPTPPEGLADALLSLLAHERQSPHWNHLGKALHLSGAHRRESVKLLKALLQGADAWPGWHAVWRRGAGIFPAFPAHLVGAAEALARAPLREAGREDLSARYTVSIDSPGTTDIDDALSLLEVTPAGVRIALHVVEPPAALRPGKPLFEEAARRISSVYTLDRRYPMLPEVLSAGRHSLLAGEAREAVTFRILLQDGDGRLERISRSVVRLDANLDFGGGDALAAEQPETWGRLAQACAALAERRKALGAMVPERWEVNINADDPQALRLSRRRRAGPGTRMVEELAILLNREAGRYCRDFRLPTIYRVQERRAGRGGTGGALEAARFSLQGGGHEGLACDRYVQVTSPMRRFPDLLMLRQIAAHVAGEPLPFRDQEQLAGWVRWAEERMPVYGEFERRAAEQWRRAYLSQNRGLAVAARVTGITEPGAGQVYLTEVELAAQATLPSGAAVGDELTCRVTAVDLDLPEVWVQAAPAGR